MTLVPGMELCWYHSHGRRADRIPVHLVEVLPPRRAKVKVISDGSEHTIPVASLMMPITNSQKEKKTSWRSKNRWCYGS
ncbi:MAG: hypothetical protein ACRDF8_00785 [Chloroflexota bacterium]